MPKESGFFNAADSAGSALTKAAETSGRSGSMSSAKYRVSSRPTDSLVSSSTDVSNAASRSPETSLSTANVSTLLKRMSKNSASHLSLSGPSGAEGSTTGTTGKPKNARYAINTEAASPPKGAGATVGTPKLPQKLRQHVNRLRNQFAMGSNAGSSIVGGRNPSSTTSPHKAPRLSMSSASINSRRFSIAAAAAIQQYSRRSNQLQQLQATKEDEKPAEPIDEAPKKTASPQESEPTIVNAGTFQDLLRPLQTSLSCASLNAGWSSDEEDDVEQLFRQSERENSRMLRVCCSIDNLMLSIGDQAQEQKRTEAIVRGATRDLVKLFQFAMSQVISVIFDKTDDQTSNNSIPRDEETHAVGVNVDRKEAQYAREFLLEVNGRIGKLYEFACSVFVNEVDGLRQRIKELEEESAAAALKNEELHMEIRDLRDFHEQNNVSSVDSFTVSSSDSRHQMLDNHRDDPAISALAFPEIPEVSSEVGDDESSVSMKQQCHELSRLLEMAKQEIRLSHHERDVQKARVAEISSALFHDSELGMLRNQLQSEKKRVRILERENLTLRESQQEQVMKLQSLEAMLAASLASTAAVNAATNAPSVSLHSNGLRRLSVDTTDADTISAGTGQQQSAVSRSDSPEDQSTIPASILTIENHDNQYNFTNFGMAQPGMLQADAQGAVMNWFTRIVNPPQPVNVRKPRQKHTESKPEQHPPVALSKFLAGLLMTDNQLATAKEESKVRKQGSVPTLIPPVGTLSSRREGRSVEDRKMAGKKRRPRSAIATSASSNDASRTNSAEAEDNPEEVVACCLQLVWSFYQRFLLAVEAQNLLATRGLGGDPNLGSSADFGAGNPVMEPVSLSVIIFHFFLERCSRELDAARELEQFVLCLHNVRAASYSLELFCQFLEKTCSRQELCFYLWVCQAMDDVRLGIPYDDPLPANIDSVYNSHQDGPMQFLCVLKATFLARTIFRLLHFKVLCRPSTAGGGRRHRKSKHGPIKRSNSNAAIVVAPTSPSSISPKRRPKTRLGELTAVSSPKADSTMPTTNSGEGQTEEKKIPLHVAAQTALREIIENNQGEPITLEAFNNLLLQYAVEPSPEELAARLGPFYQSTGDELKVPTDVFLALLMETYKFQLQWQHDQLRALFIHLNHQEEAQQRAAERLPKPDATRDKGGRRGNSENKSTSKPRIKRRTSRDGAAESGIGSKYLRGLSRIMLREFLLQSGVVYESDVAQVDIDWLFAELLKTAGGVAADITFDALYDALRKMKWLDSAKLRVDALSHVTGMLPTKPNVVVAGMRRTKEPSKVRSPSLSAPSPTVCAIRDKWRVYARHSLALCNNDPNLFVRRHSQRLLYCVDQALCCLVSESESSVGAGAIQCVREFLAFAWRLAAKRSSASDAPDLKQTCLTEVFLVSQALRTAVDSMPGYHGQFTPIEEKSVEAAEANSGLLQRQSFSSTIVLHDALQSFYDTSRMNLKHIVKDKIVSADSDSGSGQLHELENVLRLYSAHIAHLFQQFSEARYNCSPQVSFHRWRSMVYKLELVDPRRLPLSKLKAHFVSVAEASMGSEFTNAASLDQELGVGKTQFSELFVQIAIERHRTAVARKLEKAQLTMTKKPREAQDENKEALLEAAEIAGRPGRIMAQFCREILAPRAFASDNALVERNFAAKLSCPLVGRALLEHRSFLRTVFFFYAKQDELAADERAELEEQTLIREVQESGGQRDDNAQAKDVERSAVDVNAAFFQPSPGSDFQLEKTKRSSMSFGEFQTFLTAFGLLSAPDDSIDDSYPARWSSSKLALADAQHVFSSAMSLDNDDTLQLEFDEFAAAIVALAVHLDPSPFSLWHQKLHGFATKLMVVWEAQNEGARSL
ncbi:hypothetical protein PHYPSEUDO_010851 [Phytophthora pseudosyringae]|uniref:EF-hand domain-containing protein n=1 Tax=Phytophthora pseudosyringae TaxID=221518 RepID=A0A8T1V9E3_9STRA|nr:hypothetical protein PHYPSEUDO_010851 [Phytophthora pseudosyringae]